MSDMSGGNPESRFLASLLDCVEPRWDHARESADSAQATGNMDRFREERVRMGTLTMCLMQTLRQYQAAFDSFPEELEPRIESLLVKLGEETNLRIPSRN